MESIRGKQERRKKEERREKEEGRRKKEEGRRKKEEGRRKKRSKKQEKRLSSWVASVDFFINWSPDRLLFLAVLRLKSTPAYSVLGQIHHTHITQNIEDGHIRPDLLTEPVLQLHRRQ